MWVRSRRSAGLRRLSRHCAARGGRAGRRCWPPPLSSPIKATVDSSSGKATGSRPCANPHRSRYPRDRERSFYRHNHLARPVRHRLSLSFIPPSSRTVTMWGWAANKWGALWMQWHVPCVVSHLRLELRTDLGTNTRTRAGADFGIEWWEGDRFGNRFGTRLGNQFEKKV